MAVGHQRGELRVDGAQIEALDAVVTWKDSA